MLHEVGEQKDWNESFYFNFYDRGNDLCGFMRIGLKPNKKEKALFCFFLMPDGSIVGLKENVEMEDNELSAKGLKFTAVEAEKKWNLSYEGELMQMDKGEVKPVKVSFALDFDAITPQFDYRNCVTPEKEKLAQQVAAEHIEQVGHFIGTVKVEEREFVVRALGERDHSWGVREWTAPRLWLWVTCQFNEKFAFNITKLEMDKGDVDAGFLYLDGEMIPIVKVDVAKEFQADGSPAELYMAFYDKDGNVYGVKGVTKRKAMMHFEGEDKKHHAVMWETLTRFKMDEEVGFGVAEYLIRQ